MIQLYDPASTMLTLDGKTYARTPFPGNQIPVAQFSQVAKNYIALRPSSMVPNVAGSGPSNNFFSQQGGTIQPWDKGTARADHQWNANNHLSFLFLRGERDDGFLGGQPPGTAEPVQREFRLEPQEQLLAVSRGTGPSALGSSTACASATNRNMGS